MYTKEIHPELEAFQAKVPEIDVLFEESEISNN
jgi:hypothetical protein